MILNPYLKALVPVLLTVVASLSTVYGSLPWWAPVAAAVTAILTWLVPNAPTKAMRRKVLRADAEKRRAENVPPRP